MRSPKAVADATPEPRRTVALLIESSRAYARGVIRGVAHFARGHGGWSFLHQEWKLDDPAPSWLKKGSCDGVIAQIETAALFNSIRRLNVPVIDLRGLQPLDLPAVGSDDAAIARIVADHLLERGFTNVAYCGFSGVDYSQRRQAAFIAEMRAHGREPIIFDGQRPPANTSTNQRESLGLLQHKELGGWARKLPKPIGVMSCNDIRGRQLLAACRREGIDVPDEAAVIGVDNDEVLCELADPPLSSVVPACDQIGFQAASMLDRLMRGESVASPTNLRIEPLGIVTRASTDVLAVQNPVVAEALRYIRDNACTPMNVQSVADHVAGRFQGVSRTALTRQFSRVTGRSPKRHITQIRVERARRLLLETDQTLTEIAQRVGMEYPEHLHVMFKRATGLSPGEFRTRTRGGLAVG